MSSNALRATSKIAEGLDKEDSLWFLTEELWEMYSCAEAAGGAGWRLLYPWGFRGGGGSDRDPEICKHTTPILGRENHVDALFVLLRGPSVMKGEAPPVLVFPISGSLGCVLPKCNCFIMASLATLAGGVTHCYDTGQHIHVRLWEWQPPLPDVHSSAV